MNYQNRYLCNGWMDTKLHLVNKCRTRSWVFRTGATLAGTTIPVGRNEQNPGTGQGVSLGAGSSNKLGDEGEPSHSASQVEKSGDLAESQRESSYMRGRPEK